MNLNVTINDIDNNFDNISDDIHNDCSIIISLKKDIANMRKFISRRNIICLLLRNYVTTKLDAYEERLNYLTQNNKQLESQLNYNNSLN